MAVQNLVQVTNLMAVQNLVEVTNLVAKNLIVVPLQMKANLTMDLMENPVTGRLRMNESGLSI